MNSAKSITFLTLVLLSLINVRCWNIPDTDVPTNFASTVPEINTGNNFPKQSDDHGQVVETHHTTCQITTEELVATAKATATRVLTGICNSREMDERFKSLEGQVAELLNVLKVMISNLDVKVSVQSEALRSRMQPPERNEDGGDLECRGSQCQSPSFDGVITPAVEYRKLEERTRMEIPGDTTTTFRQYSWPREEEILRLNNSVHMEPYPESVVKHGISLVYSKVFTYYWRVHGISSKINSWDPRKSLRSPSFYITPNGYKMYLLLFPRQNFVNFYIHVGISSGANDANLPWPFSLKHRIELLDQVRTVPSTNRYRSRPMIPQDLSSRVWNPALLCNVSVWRRPLSGDSTECVGLGYPHEILKSRNYIYNDSVVIKLTIYLS